MLNSNSFGSHTIVTRIQVKLFTLRIIENSRIPHIIPYTKAKKIISFRNVFIVDLFGFCFVFQVKNQIGQKIFFLIKTEYEIIDKVLIEMC